MFASNLAHLNTSIIASVGSHVRVWGNYCYGHLHPLSGASTLFDQGSANKRERLKRAVRNKKCMVDVGFHSGHNLLVALDENPKMEVHAFGGDLTSLAALNSLRTNYPDANITYYPFSTVGKRFEYMCDLEIDIVHLNGDRDAFRDDLIMLMPFMSINTTIVFNDSHQGNIAALIHDLERDGLITDVDNMSSLETYRNTIAQFQPSYYSKVMSNMILLTKDVQDLFLSFVADNEIHRMVDIGCGIKPWIPSVFAGDYVGIDVNKSVIRANCLLYRNNSRASTLCLDVVISPLTHLIPFPPQLVFCKDFLCHLYNNDALAVINNLRALKPSYLLVSTNPGTDNLTRRMDKYHSAPIDLTAAPFHLVFTEMLTPEFGVVRW